MAEGRVSRLLGKERIAQLREAFPQVPPTMIVKADIMQEGIKHTGVMDEVGRWAIPDVHDLFVYDHEYTHSKEDVVAGHVLTPHSMYFRDGVACMMFFDSTGPYEVRYEGRGCFMLYRDNDPIEEVRFPPCPQWYRKTTSSGKPMSSIIGLRAERHVRLVATNYCEYWKDGNQCLFCNMNTTAAHFAELGQQRVLVKQEQDVYETYLAAAMETGVDSFGFTGGSFYNCKKAADLYIRLIKAAKRAMKQVGQEAEVYAGIQPMKDEEDHIRLKEAGATTIVYAFEVWDPRLFQIICPGKAKNPDQEKWIEASIRAVDIFGRGNVWAQFVLGIELCAPFGFKDQEEALASTLEGWEFLLSHGVIPRYTPFRDVPGSKVAGSPLLLTEYVLRAEVERKRLLAKYNLFHKPGNIARPDPRQGNSICEDWVDLTLMDRADVWPFALAG